MKRLVLVSTELEIKNFIDQIAHTKMESGYLTGRGSEKVFILIGGVGVPSTILELSAYLNNHQADQVIQVGFGGSFDKDLSIGQLVEVNQDCFADLGIQDGSDFTPLHQYFDEFTSNSGWLTYAPRTSLPAKKGISVNMTSGSADRVRLMKNIWNPDVESMEGAAAMLVCQKYQKTFTQVRVISNFAGPKSTAAWDVQTAQKKLSDWLIDFL